MNNKYGLVLAGGGSKGAYQLGAWQAMNEMKIEFEAVAGVSIGSINGALIAMGDFENALEFWDSIAVEKGLSIADELKDSDNLFARKNWPALLRHVLKYGGVDASPAKAYFEEFISEERVRSSKVNFGLVTIDLAKGEPVQLFKKDIPQGQLVDFLLASANVPFAKNIGPEGGRYLDGGAYDNTPISFMRQNGYNRLIVVDIATIRGVGHDPNIDNCEVIYIRPSDPEALGKSFDFSSSMNQKRMRMGYLDTMKAFSKLLGNIFRFSPTEFRSMVEEFSADGMLQLEELAAELGLDKLKIYTKNEFLSSLKDAYEKSKEENAEAEKVDELSGEDPQSALSQGLRLTSEELKDITNSLLDYENELKKQQGRHSVSISKILESLLEKLASKSSNEEVQQGEEAEEEPNADDSKKSSIGSILELLRSKKKNEKDFSKAIEILENLE